MVNLSSLAEGCREALQTGQERDGGDLEDTLGGRARLPSRETSGVHAAGLSGSETCGWSVGAHEGRR